MPEQDDYEYSQPMTYQASTRVIAGSNSLGGVKLNNPFGTECEACILFAFFSGAAVSTRVSLVADGLPAVNIDNMGDQSDSNNGQRGYTFIGTMTTGSLVPYWFDVKEYILLQSNNSAGQWIITIGYRRRKQVYKPEQQQWALNEPTA